MVWTVAFEELLDLIQEQPREINFWEIMYFLQTAHAHSPFLTIVIYKYDDLSSTQN